jgi:hypothetical protein
MVPWEGGAVLVAPDDPDAVRIQGRILDGAGEPVDDSVVEVWQANVHGRYAHAEDTREVPLVADFEGFGRAITDRDGRFTIVTVKPGCVPGPGEGVQAPHISLSVFARGLLKHLVTSRTATARRRCTSSTSTSRGRGRPSSSTCRSTPTRGGAISSWSSPPVGPRRSRRTPAPPAH